MGKNSNVLFQNKNSFTRINYLYQAAYMILTQNQDVELVRFYVHTLRSIAKKQVLRLHPNIKRTLCKKCNMLLVPGVTAKVRKKANRQPRVIVMCVDCKTPKRFPCNQNYRLWCEQQEAWLLSPEEARNKQRQETAPKPKEQQISNRMKKRLAAREQAMKDSPENQNQEVQHETEILDSQEKSKTEIPKNQVKESEHLVLNGRTNDNSSAADCYIPDEDCKQYVGENHHKQSSTLNSCNSSANPR